MVHRLRTRRVRGYEEKRGRNGGTRTLSTTPPLLAPVSSSLAPTHALLSSVCSPCLSLPSFRAFSPFPSVFPGFLPGPLFRACLPSVLPSLLPCARCVPFPGLRCPPPARGRPAFISPPRGAGRPFPGHDAAPPPPEKEKGPQRTGATDVNTDYQPHARTPGAHDTMGGEEDQRRHHSQRGSPKPALRGEGDPAHKRDRRAHCPRRLFVFSHLAPRRIRHARECSGPRAAARGEGGRRTLCQQKGRSGFLSQDVWSGGQASPFGWQALRDPSDKFALKGGASAAAGSGGHTPPAAEPGGLTASQ